MSPCGCCAQAFLQKALMPLHKPKGLGVYQQQLSYCVTQVGRHLRLVCDATLLLVLSGP
jgi:serine/threonine-protein phosphatase 2A regulatory subunit B'